MHVRWCGTGKILLGASQELMRLPILELFQNPGDSLSLQLTFTVGSPEKPMVMERLRHVMSPDSAYGEGMGHGVVRGLIHDERLHGRYPEVFPVPMTRCARAYMMAMSRL